MNRLSVHLLGNLLPGKHVETCQQERHLASKIRTGGHLGIPTETATTVLQSFHLLQIRLRAVRHFYTQGFSQLPSIIRRCQREYIITLGTSQSRKSLQGVLFGVSGVFKGETSVCHALWEQTRQVDVLHRWVVSRNLDCVGHMFGW